MQCLNCQALLRDGARYCVECGAPAPVACQACRHSNPFGATFCARCGLRLTLDASEPPVATHAPTKGGPPAVEEVAPAAERRQLTVLFCDLVGSTALSSRLDPEDLRDVIGAYHRCVAETVGRFDGFVARYMGDGALVYFGYPQAHEDNAERAVRAALALVSNIGTLRTAPRASEYAHRRRNRLGHRRRARERRRCARADRLGSRHRTWPRGSRRLPTRHHS